MSRVSGSAVVPIRPAGGWQDRVAGAASGTGSGVAVVLPASKRWTPSARLTRKPSPASDHIAMPDSKAATDRPSRATMSRRSSTAP